MNQNKEKQNSVLYQFPDTVFRIESHGTPTDADLSNDGKFLVVSYLEAPELRMYDCETGLIVFSYSTEDGFGKGVVFVQHKIWLLVSGYNNEFILEIDPKLNTTREVTRFAASWTAPTLKRNKESSLIAVQGFFLEVLDPQGQTVRVLESKDRKVAVVANFAAEKPEAYCCNLDYGYVVLWDLMKNQEIQRWSIPRQYGESITVSPTGKYLIVTSWGMDGGVFIIDCETGNRILTDQYNENTPGGNRFCFLLDNETIAYKYAFNIFLLNLKIQKKQEGPKIRERNSPFSGIYNAWEAPVIAYIYEDGFIGIIHLLSCP